MKRGVCPSVTSNAQWNGNLDNIESSIIKCVIYQSSIPIIESDPDIKEKPPRKESMMTSKYQLNLKLLPK